MSPIHLKRHLNVADTASQAVPAEPLGEQAYVAIKKLILTRELLPGDQLKVALLCERLGLGRSPVHLAIHRLGREGLVDILPRKGILVKSVTLDGFLELIASRQLIEPYLASLAFEHASPDLLRKLRGIVDLAWQCHHESDSIGAMEADRLFHHTLYEAAGNRTLADFASLLLDRSILLWFRPRNIDVATVNVTELETILDGFLSGDKTTVVTHMEEHILSVRAKYLGKDAG